MTKERNAWTRAAYFIRKNKLPQMTIGAKRFYTLPDDPGTFERLTGATRPPSFPERLILGDSAQQVLVSLLGLTYLLQMQQISLIEGRSLQGLLSLFHAAACLKFLEREQPHVMASESASTVILLADCLSVPSDHLVHTYLELRG